MLRVDGSFRLPSVLISTVILLAGYAMYSLFGVFAVDLIRRCVCMYRDMEKSKIIVLKL